MTEQVRFRVRPVYHGTDLLIEVMGDHRGAGFPDVAAILSEALHAKQEPHPDKLDGSELGLLEGHLISYWTYAGGAYEVDDDAWGLFISALPYNKRVISDAERALLASRQFIREDVDFKEYE